MNLTFSLEDYSSVEHHVKTRYLLLQLAEVEFSHFVSTKIRLKSLNCFSPPDRRLLFSLDLLFSSSMEEIDVTLII